MAEFSLDRFKYRWRGDWTTATSYRRDDIVRLNGKSYVCLVAHTSSSAFRTDLNATLPGSTPPQPQPRWVVMTSGRSFVGNWSSGTDYNLGDVVAINGSLWLCTVSHQATTFENDYNYWTLLAYNIKFIGDWNPSTEYTPSAVVKYNGIAYECLNPHTSSSTLENNINDWKIFHEGIEYRGSWLPTTVYRKNDYVKYGGTIFKCNTTHTSGPEQLDIINFDIEFPGFQFDGIWSSTTVYNAGDVVRYGGYLYYATDNSLDVDPTRQADDSTVSWLLLSKSYNFQGTWSSNGVYKIGDLVLRGGQLFQAVRDINISQGDGSTTDYLDPEVWELIAPGKIYSNEWQAQRLYSVGEVVTYFGTAYVCNLEHDSQNDNFPGDNGSGYAFWDILVQAGQPGGMLYKGDLLTYGLSRTLVGDGSTQGDTRLAIGNQGEKLSVSDQLEAYWRNVINDAEVIYVNAIIGSDDTGDGTLYNPFKTVRHACEYVEDNFTPLTPTKVSVATGRYEEIGPIIIPAGCVVMGDELRSTTIVATPPISSYANDFQYVQSYITYFNTFLFDLLTNNTVDYGYTGGEGQITNLPASDGVGSASIVAKLQDYQDYIEFRVASGSVDPVRTGSNTANSVASETNAAEILNANKLFILNEIFAFLEDQHPTISWNRSRIKSDVYALIRGIRRDLNFAGNYATLLAGKRYVNATNGSQLDDLFYVRDTTGLRNCTIDGLQGSLNPPGVFAQFQRPTGGACVSLDPGWGPADDRTWIVNRSPYIQGVTNIGTACVGKKVDGSLHNGGNKSMVSNDFTQVLSDGIGAWVLNNARAELVSVFTYYCQVGYLAENGGIIRATNGNNSYGSFGSVAEGNDPNEVPQNVTVWNRNNEAQVDTAFAGGNADELFIFEYTHCGEEYTTASAEIVGAGAAANVLFDDFRDGGLYEARLINTQGSGSEGGTNYLVRQNSAQITSGAQTRIILNSNETTQFESEILGMRILIVSGDGAGQYGIVDGYDQASKVCDVIKESDGTAGWDHVIPGTPIEGALDSTAVYRIEPRMTVNHPGFTNSSVALGSTRAYLDAAYGGITETYTGLTASLGNGETLGTPTPAVFSVVRRGSTYEPTITSGGAGYAVGDTITFAGTLLGGNTPNNDLIITVTEIPEDSTNDITAFTFTGRGRDGRILAVSTGTNADYSDNGVNYLPTTLPFSANWLKCLNGADAFVVVPRSDNKVAWSLTGASWTTRALPSTLNWTDGVFGDKFVLIAEGTNEIAYSTTGFTWLSSNLPAGDDSAGDQWQAIAYGAETYVAISGSQTKDVAYSSDGITWSMYSNVLPAGDYDWVSLEYGNNRFLALASNGTTAYSLDKGATWYSGSLDNDGLGSLIWRDMKYGQGVFFAIARDGTSATDICNTTEDGVYSLVRNLNPSYVQSAVTFSNINNAPRWNVFNNNANFLESVLTGAQAKVRADVFQGKFQSVKIWDPGSGYNAISNPATITTVDTQFISEVETQNRIGNGVLAQPSFLNRGAGYRVSTSTVTITGDGYADIIPEEQTVTVKGVTTVPGPGAQLRFSTIPDETTEDPTDLLLFTGVGVEDLGPDDSGTGSRLVRFTISPSLKNTYNLEHGTATTLRVGYAQCRISGHDFLDIGTGNFQETNYPELYAGGAFFTAAPENEVLEVDGGRVFYVSTDQDGNFRTGELFGVDQATGIVTISAEFFDLDGLSELSLGGVRLGGSGTIVNEFSTDPTFAADSNNIIPTQRAIASFLANRLSVGGSDLETSKLIAGTVSVGGQANEIEVVGGGYLQMPSNVDFFAFDDNGNQGNIQGTIISQMLFLRNNDDTTQ